MSNLIQGLAWKQELDVHAKLVLVALADHADDDGYCWPGLRGMAKKCSMDRRTVQRKVRELEALGLLWTEPGRGKHGTSLYYLNLSVAIKGQSKPLEGGGSVPPLQQRHDGAAPCRPGRQPRHTGGGTVPPESSEENHQKKEIKRREEGIAAAPPPPSLQVVMSQLSDSEAASVEWILFEWGKIPGVTHPLRLMSGHGIDKAVTVKIREHSDKIWWLELFAIVAASPFLCGEIAASPGQMPFRASLDWLLGPKNLAKTLEGKYLRRPGDRLAVRGKFDPGGTMEWALCKQAEREELEQAERKELAHDRG